MQTSLAVTALLMGLAGGPHCIAMCGAACAGIGQAAGPRKNVAMWSFQVGRVLGYSTLGAVAAASMQALGTSVSMMAGPWFWLRLRGKGSGDWGVRLAGLALAASSGWALWMAFAHN